MKPVYAHRQVSFLIFNIKSVNNNRYKIERLIDSKVGVTLYVGS